MSTPVLHLVAGPDGAGKSTFAAEVLEPVTHLPFVNADAIAHQRWPGAESEHAYDASRAAAEERSRLMAAKSSFVTETVFSHPSKVDLVDRAGAVGYVIHLHVILVPESVAVPRVDRGGHDAPEQKIRDLYARLWPLVAVARDLVDRTTFYDNTRAASPFRVVATYERRRLIGEPTWPTWTPPSLLA